MKISQLIEDRKTKPVKMALPKYEVRDGYHPQGTVPWNLELINAALPWEETAGQEPVGVIADTGVDVYHPVLKPRIINPTNVTTDGPPANVTDFDGHGTHVAGIAVNCYSDARIMPLKLFAKNPTGWEFQDGLARLVEYNRQVYEADKIVAVNCSWGGPYDPILHCLIRELIGQGTMIICSAGNAGDGRADTSEIFNWPAFLYEPVTVGAIDKEALAAKYSSSYDGIDLAAPGSDIHSCWPGGGYKALSGTSMATPHVFALVLRIYAAFRKREERYPTVDEAEAILWRHVQKLNLAPQLVGLGLIDYTYDRRRWPLYRVQLGAYFQKENAEAAKNKATEAELSTYMVKY